MLQMWVHQRLEWMMLFRGKAEVLCNVNKERLVSLLLKCQYQNPMEYEWNELVYNSKFSFEPVIGYHLYRDANAVNSSLIGPNKGAHWYF
jgi:hypothetical protein